MNNYDSLITVLGWEDRSCDGVLHDLETNKIKSLFALEFERNANTPKSICEPIEEYCTNSNINFFKVKINSSSSIESWRSIEAFSFSNTSLGNKILLNITTMPREIIWSLLFFLRQNENCTIDYVYYKPKKYTDKWLSKEPQKPQLLFKHSGITEIGKPTALIIITGFDVDRTRQLINFYEPNLTVLGIQTGNQFDNTGRNEKSKHISECKGLTNFKDFSIDAYSNDHGFNTLKKEIMKLKKYNIIISSLGPKLTTIPVYKLIIEFPEVAISYVSSKQYNNEYSSGLGERFFGSFSN
ncbi:hypothetical protein [Rufibacter immobilis]|uniref:hypothetical protein n=1 Tax=Rufibacter immobilis TaxID=1348778 RepID=UPI0035EBF741